MTPLSFPFAPAGRVLSAAFCLSVLLYPFAAAADPTGNPPLPGQAAGRALVRNASPASESWQAMEARDRERQAQIRADIAAGRRPPHPIPRVQPEEEMEEEEMEEIEPAPHDAPSTPPLVRRSAAASLAAPRAPQALTTSFKGDDLQDVGNLTGSYYIPPDTQGAVGLNHFVEMTNGTASVYSKTGTRLSAVSLDSFFTLTRGGITYPQNGSTDPRVLYDRRSGRWFACIIEIGTSTSGENNNILLAVSRGSDPLTSIWDKYVVPVGIPTAQGKSYFNDYESLAVDDNGVYFGMRVFVGRNGSRARIVATPKASLLAASPSLGAVYDFDNITDMFSTPQPAVNFDPVPANGTAWFVASSSSVYANLHYRRLIWSGGVPSLDSTSIVLTTPGFAAPVDAPSSGATKAADVGDMRVMMALIRNGRLWTCRHVGVNSSGAASGADRTACEFLELNVTGPTATVVQTGRVFDTAVSTPRFYYYPALSVSGQGHVAMSMSGSRSTEYIGTYTCGRYASDPLGAMGVPSLVKAGEAKYTVTFSGTVNRWGDYSYTSLDPADDMTMWSIQEYARTPQSTQDMWSTWIGRLAAPAPTLNNPGASGGQGQTSYTLALTGSGFYDPGPGFPNRLTVSLAGGSINGVSNLSVVYNSPSSLTVIFDIAPNATPGSRDIVVTNPDGQSATAPAGFTVTAASPDTAPVLTVPPSASGIEDADLVIAGISVNDPDLGAGTLLVSLSVAGGVIDLSSTSGLIFTAGADRSASMQFSGTQASVNGAISGLRYRGNPNKSGSDTLSILVNDQGYSGYGGPLTDSKTVPIWLDPVNDPPVISAPASRTAVEDTPLLFGAAAGSVLGLSDPDAGSGNLEVVLSASTGTVTLSTAGGLSVVGNGTSDLVLTGTLTAINAALDGLTWLPPLNYFGSAILAVSASDLGNSGAGGALSTLRSIPITVNGVNDLPVVVTNTGAAVDEGSSVTLTPLALRAEDVESTPGQLSFTIQSVPYHGSLRLDGTLLTTSSAFSQAGIDAETLSYTHDGSETTSDSFRFLLSDSQGGNAAAPGEFLVSVNPVNDGPHLIVPGSQSGRQDADLLISGCALSDPDAGEGPVQLTLSAQHGTLSLASTAGLVFSDGDGAADGTMTFTGSPAALNAALAGLSYRPSAGYTGPDLITLGADDLGHTGFGGFLADTQQISINVEVPVGLAEFLVE